MKKYFVLLLTVFFLINVAHTQSVEILQAIDKSSKEISNTLPGKSKVAVAAFFSDSKELSSYLSQEVVKKLMQRGTFTIIERNEKNMSLMNAEMEYQYSGNVSDDSMVEFGNRLGAKYLVYGSFEQLGGSLQFTIQVTNVESGEIPYLKSYTIIKTAQLTELFGENWEITSVEDYINSIARCQRKMSAIEKDKSKAIQNQSSDITARFQKQINAARAEERNPWESKTEYETRINEAVTAITKKRDTELAGIEKEVGIKFDNRLKQVELQKNKLVKDLQNTTFSLTDKAVQVNIGAFRPDDTPKNWPVSIKSLNKQVAYTYNGKYVVNDADVKSEYQSVEKARKTNDFEGEIAYRIIEGAKKDNFELFIVSVRVYIKSSGSTIMNENINKSVGLLNSNKTVLSSSGRGITDMFKKDGSEMYSFEESVKSSNNSTEYKSVPDTEFRTERDLLASGYIKHAISREAVDYLVFTTKNYGNYVIDVWASGKKTGLKHGGIIEFAEKYKAKLPDRLYKYQFLYIKILNDDGARAFPMGEKHHDQYFEIR